MSKIKKIIRNIRFGTQIRSVLMSEETLEYQNVISCSTNQGKTWSSAVVGLTNKRFIIEWQRNRGRDISMPYSEIAEWNVTDEIGGIAELCKKFLPIKAYSVDIKVKEYKTIRMSARDMELEILKNQLQRFCTQNMR